MGATLCLQALRSYHTRHPAGLVECQTSIRSARVDQEGGGVGVLDGVGWVRWLGNWIDWRVGV